VDLEWLILADSAQVVDNKLYLLGGGWDVLTVTTGFPIHKHLAVAAAFRIPWTETNQRHTVEIEIADEDGATLARVTGQLEIGRPVGIPVGHSQRFQLPMEALLTFAHPGTYVVTARIAGGKAGRTTFNVVPAPH
jgi:hypothetical protein